MIKIQLRRAMLGILITFSASSFAIVDMKSANFSDNWVDIIVPGVGYDLRVNRTYNSRSLFSGIFGFGWCSDFETKVEVTPESNIRLTECGAGLEIIFTPQNFNPEKISDTIDRIVAELKKKRTDLTPDYLAKLSKEMETNDFMREEFGRRLNLKGAIKGGTVYFANGRETDRITLKSGSYRRTLPDGTSQAFDANTGHLTHVYDRNQNYLKLSWNKDILQTVADNMGRKLTFKFNATTRKVEKIVGPGKLAASYVIKGEDLESVVDSNGEKFTYKYDDVHNLTRIGFADGTYKALTYNKDKDWALTFRNQKGCVEKYDYNESKDDPKNHFFSIVEKKCGGKVTNQSKYEFIHKPRKSGPGVYLYRVRSENNKKVTDIVYHDVFNKPISILRDGEKTEYTYYGSGLTSSKTDSSHKFTYQYTNACKKVSHVEIQYLAEATGKRKPSQNKSSKVERIVKTSFEYDKGKCNLIAASNSEGQQVKLQYDTQGRIAQIEDQAKKVVRIKYESKYGKPATVTRPGLGAIDVTYKTDGEIQKVESKQGPKVAVQVASIFNNLLDIIAPATNDMAL